jgi:hypothetical protein
MQHLVSLLPYSHFLSSLWKKFQNTQKEESGKGKSEKQTWGQPKGKQILLSQMKMGPETEGYARGQSHGKHIEGQWESAVGGTGLDKVVHSPFSYSVVPLEGLGSYTFLSYLTWTRHPSLAHLLYACEAGDHKRDAYHQLEVAMPSSAIPGRAVWWRSCGGVPQQPQQPAKVQEGKGSVSQRTAPSLIVIIIIQHKVFFFLV